MRKLQELFMNEHGEFSTTNTIQLISVCALSVGFLAALFFDKAIVADLAYAIAAIGLGTPISKGIVDYKREINVVSKSVDQRLSDQYD